MAAGLVALLIAASACGKKDAAPTASSQPSATTSAPTTASAATAPKTSAGPMSKLTGLAVDPDTVSRRVLAVTFDNHPDARPQAGLSQADIVYEMKVEGTYTRYMGLFQTNAPDRLGPIRSARDCFLDRMVEYNATYAHFGGSYTALQRIEQMMYSDLNGMTMGGDAMFRDDSTGKEAPHNVYADAEALRQIMADRGDDFKVDLEPLAFNNTVQPAGGAKPAQTVTIEYAGDNETRYEYQADTGLYRRYKDGVLEIDEAGGAELAVQNIIIQAAESWLFAPPLRKIEQVGTGTGFYVTQGGVVPVTWTKADELAPTYYFTEDGKPLLVNPGQTWIQVVDPDTPVTFE